MNPHRLVQVIDRREVAAGSSAAELNGLASRCESEWLAFGSADGNAISEAVASFSARGESTEAILLGPGDIESRRMSSRLRYPALLAIFMQPPHSALLPVLRVSAVNGALKFRDVSDPLWDWLIRAAKMGRVTVSSAWDANLVQDAGDSPCCELVPDRPSRELSWLAEHLQAMQPIEVMDEVASVPDGVALKAGLLQIHNFLETSHQQSQSIEGEGKHRSGDYWHAIMHRREPDYGNSKYWFRRVGRHPVFEPLARGATPFLKKSQWAGAAGWLSKLVTPRGWVPAAFVDMCQAAASSDDAGFVAAAGQIQRAEMLLLLEQTYADAAGLANPLTSCGVRLE
jgi:hypothetical protein